MDGRLGSSPFETFQEQRGAAERLRQNRRMFFQTMATKIRLRLAWIALKSSSRQSLDVNEAGSVD
jgi:hypothetical protein